MKQTFRTLLGYQAWANDDLFDKLATLDPARHGTELHTALRLLNHAYVVAQIFKGHLSGNDHGYVADNTEDTPSLAALRKAWAASDGWYLDYVEGVTPDALAEAIHFTFTDGDNACMTREEMLLHIVLHSSAHRAEVDRILWQLSVTPPWDTLAVYLHRTDPSRRQGSRLQA